MIFNLREKETLYIIKNDGASWIDYRRNTDSYNHMYIYAVVVLKNLCTTNQLCEILLLFVLFC